ncbi:transmembrane protein 47-like [Babylonia areolata]|uniref:transmembrane protein 47-like n=1 Tax=Babylonia areolata TaxID=304850 RepID=UPI003FD2F821
MGETEVRVCRPYKLLAVIMSMIAFILMIVSVAGPDWMEVSFEQGNPKSWGLWWDCVQVNGVSFLEMCVETDWLFACAALVMIGLLCMLAVSIVGSIGLCTHKRLLYIIAGVVTIFAMILQIICLIIYPVKFTEEVKEDKYYRAETQSFDLDWTYGVAWGAVCFMLGAAVLFLIRTETDHSSGRADNTPPPVYLSYTRA